jgi:hypothetical protein
VGMTVGKRFILHDLDHRSYAVLDNTVIGHSEWIEIAEWCDQNNYTYYGIGVVEFSTPEAMTLFIMRWA